jgi:hypothetical protein
MQWESWFGYWWTLRILLAFKPSKLWKARRVFIRVVCTLVVIEGVKRVIVDEHCMMYSIRPELGGQVCIDEYAPNHVHDAQVESLCRSIWLREASFGNLLSNSFLAKKILHYFRFGVLGSVVPQIDKWRLSPTFLLLAENLIPGFQCLQKRLFLKSCKWKEGNANPLLSSLLVADHLVVLAIYIVYTWTPG